jgi:HAE1 family hydrophobic/amphiphilic exporter-1
VDGFVNSIINFVIRNKLAVWLLTFIVTITGMYAGANMKKEMIPDISIPYVIVMAVYPGAAPEQVMDEVTIPLEDAIGLLPGVKSINSSSYSNMTTLQVEYDYSKDMDEAQRQIRSAIEQLKLPDNVMEPTITRFSMNAMPVLGLSISSESMDITDLTHVVETQIMPELRRMEGASAAMYGQHIEEIELTYDEARMASLGLTEENVKQMIQISDAKVPLGLFPFEDAEQAVVVDGKVTTVDQLKQILIPVTPSETNPVPFVTLGDIAQVELIGRVESVSRTNGQDAIAIQVTKAQDANTVDVVNDVKKLVERFEADIEGLKIDITLNQDRRFHLDHDQQGAVRCRFRHPDHPAVPAGYQIDDHLGHLDSAVDPDRAVIVVRHGHQPQPDDPRRDDRCDRPRHRRLDRRRREHLSPSASEGRAYEGARPDPLSDDRDVQADTLIDARYRRGLPAARVRWRHGW